MPRGRFVARPDAAGEPADEVTTQSEVTSTDAVESRKHEFRPYTFTAPVTCDQCRKWVWGAKRHALKCEFCGFNCHKECEGKCRATCGTVGALRLRYRYTDEYILPLPAYSKLVEVAARRRRPEAAAAGRVLTDG